MRVADEDIQKKIRRQAAEALLVYDIHNNLPLGQIVDMSAKGMKVMNEFPANVFHLYFCKIILEEEINGRNEVFFDAECRWCRQDEITGWYTSGYLLRYPTPEDAEIVHIIMHRWMKAQLEKKYSKYGTAKKERRGFLRRIFRSKSGK